MSVKSMLAAVGMTPDRVQRVARRCAKRRPADDGTFESGADLVEAINENRECPGGPAVDPAVAADIAYNGVEMPD